MTKGIKAKDVRDFKKYAEKLSKIIERIREYAPEAHIYVACNEMNLMCKSDFGMDSIDAQELVVESVLFPAMDCGDW